MKFTFKRNLPQGRWKSFHQIQTDIKLKGVIVGSINETKDGRWCVGFQIMKHAEQVTPKDPCKWKWMWFHPVVSEENARKLVNHPEMKQVLSKYTLKMED